MYKAKCAQACSCIHKQECKPEPCLMKSSLAINKCLCACVIPHSDLSVVCLDQYVGVCVCLCLTSPVYVSQSFPAQLLLASDNNQVVFMSLPELEVLHVISDVWSSHRSICHFACFSFMLVCLISAVIFAPCLEVPLYLSLPHTLEHPAL